MLLINSNVFSRAPARYGKTIDQSRKRSLRKLTRNQEIAFGAEDNTVLSFANYRHHGKWYVGHVPKDSISKCRLIYETFKWGPFTCKHRYLKFECKPGKEIKLVGQEESNLKESVMVDSVLFSPEGVAGDTKIRFFQTMLPFYSVAYCFRSGQYLDIRAKAKGVKIFSKEIDLNSEQANSLLQNCVLRSASRYEKDTGHLFNSCGPLVWEQLHQLTDKIAPRRNSLEYVVKRTKIAFCYDTDLMAEVGVSKLMQEGY